MENVVRCTRELTEAIRGCQAYHKFTEAKEEIRKNPELFERLNQFRRRNYELQNGNGSSEWYEDAQRFEREKEELFKNPAVRDFLTGELELCRMIQFINREIVGTVGLEIEGFADAIEW